MMNYGSISQTENNIDDGTPPSRARRILCTILGVGVLYLGFVRARSSSEPKDNGSFCFSDRQCKSEICCGARSITGVYGWCQECCVADNLLVRLKSPQGMSPAEASRDCAAKIEQPPAGEFGKPFCSRAKGVCQAYANGESSLIAGDGYPLWLPSDTMDNSREFYKLLVPRTVFSGTPEPVFEQVWYIDFNEQDDEFNTEGVNFNGTHIEIPVWEHLHAGYSRSYYSYDEHETGIITLVGGENELSLVTMFPKVAFVEKYHTLTYNGKMDTRRGDWIRAKSEEQMKSKWRWHKWYRRTLAQAVSLFRRNSPFAQVEAGIDRALTWQVRRYVESYPKEDIGSVNPSSSRSWASHSEKAKEAINSAKDDTFEREFLKSEVHCKHLEERNGVGAGYTDTHFVLPVGRPITMSSGEMLKSPVYYLGFVVGHVTAHYDQDANVLQLFYQGYSQSRQYTDVKFRGPYPSGLYVSPVAEGSDYAVNPDIDGRGDVFYQPSKPPDDRSMMPWSPKQADFTLWQRPRSETCSFSAENGSFWEELNYFNINESFFTWLMQHKHALKGMVRGMPCADYFMGTDYGDDTHGLGLNELVLWGHMLMESGKHGKDVSLGKFWDMWECFYRKKDPAFCHK